MSETIHAGKLPVLALRGLAVFPEQTIHFEVGRKKSILALEEAMKNDQIILLIPQRDIAVDDPFLVHFLQGVGDGKHQLKDRLRLKNTVLAQICGQVDAVKVFHDDIRRTVFFKVFSDVDNTRNIGQLRDLSGFLQKVLQAFFEEGNLIVGGCRYQLTDVVVAVDIAVGKVFLDGDASVQRQISADIGDAEAAFSDTVADQYLFVEDGTGL